MPFNRLVRSRSAALAVLIGGVTITAAGAANAHRFAVTQATGSGGAMSFIQSSTTGGGLQGQSGGATLDTGYTPGFGVLGVYNTSGNTFGSGVIGISATGYGIAGETLSNSQPSILAYPGGNGDGLQATTSSTTGPQFAVHAEAKGDNYAGYFQADGQGYAGYFSSQNGTVLIATGPGATGVALLGEPGGTGVEAQGFSGNATPALNVGGTPGTDLADFTNTRSGTPSVIVQATSANRSGEVVTDGASNVEANDVQFAGDIYLSGKVYQSCADFPATTSSQCRPVTAAAESTSAIERRTSSGTRVTMYGNASTVPKLEDYGEGSIVGGRGFVRLDPRFASTISRAQPYMVIVTPNGDSRGVYVANRTLAGFEVRENGGGRTTMSFDYRIVASPLDDHSTRLALVAPHHLHRSSLTRQPSTHAEIKHLLHVRPIQAYAFATGLHR